ncbi:hypothetical protein F4809DRAFT_644669 [Biscogniauxia mediterranea]|nr:hypothetical protein F4809DRAFT_644669 [Biscogniauxia mediterranea]
MNGDVNPLELLMQTGLLKNYYAEIGGYKYAQTIKASNLISELVMKGVCIQTPCCDAANRVSLRSTLASYLEKMPPIKGCIQAAMVMTLAGYNAGNTYQDALARYRVTQGERAASLDIGGVVDGGYLTGLDKFISGMRRAKEFVPMCTRKVCALLDVYCDPNTTLSRETISCRDRIDKQKPMHSYGLDSLSAIDLRNWVRNVFNTRLASLRVSRRGELHGGRDSNCKGDGEDEEMRRHG